MPGRYNEVVRMKSVEALLFNSLLTLKMFLSVEITLEATIQNKFSKYWKFPIEISVVEFLYSTTLAFTVFSLMILKLVIL